MEENIRNGSICISNEVIADIAIKAAREVEGVSNVYQRILDGAKTYMSSKVSMVKGIAVVPVEGGIDLTVQISVLFGFKIPEVCAAVQKTVEEAVTDMTGIPVQHVNVSVIGVAVDKDSLPQTAD